MGAAGIMLATSLMYLLSFACYLAVALRRAGPERMPIECARPSSSCAAVHSFVARRRRRAGGRGPERAWARAGARRHGRDPGRQGRRRYALDPKVSRAVLNTVGEGGGLRGIWSNVRRVRAAPRDT